MRQGVGLAPLLVEGQLADWRGACREQGQTVVLTNGCFDLLHRGHVESLMAAASLGDVLLVAINDDASVRALKGQDRPIHDQGARALILRALRAVDAVTIFRDSSVLPTIMKVKPDILAKGAEYAESEVVGAREIASWGGRVARLPMVSGHGTTGLVDRIRGGTRPPQGEEDR